MQRKVIEINKGYVLRLCKEVLDNIKEDDYNPDFVLCILKGGLIPGEIISDNLNRRLEFIRLSSYSNREQKGIKKYQDNLGNIEGKNVLVVDDILDSGNTLDYLTGYLKDIKRVSEVRTAVLLSKTQDRNNNYYGRLVKKNPWYHFYWEKD